MKTVQFPNLGYVITEFSVEDIQPILDDIAQIDSSTPTIDHSHVGNIVHEYRLRDASLDCLGELLGPLVNAYAKDNHYTVQNRPIGLTNAWVNLQQSGEYFSAHTHKGVFSFALWITVPFTQADEVEWRESRGKSGRESANFTFHYTDALGRITPYCIPVDSSYERTCIVFPGEMMHSVTPYFSTDERRITVSGNIEYLDTPGADFR
jgi:hypothetical protein